MVRWAREAKPGDFGAFAPRVFRRAAERDPIALEIAAKAARAVGVLTRRVVALGAKRVALVGGAGEALRPYLDPEIAALLSAPLHDAADGAILFVGGAIAIQEGGRAMKVFTGARIFDGERLHDDCALVVEGASIAALTRFSDRPRGGEQIDLGGGILGARLHRLADQRRRGSAVQRRADGGRDRRDRGRASARGRNRLPADRGDRCAARARRGAGGRARGAEPRSRRARGPCRRAVHRSQAQGRASGRVHPSDAGGGRRRADRRALGRDGRHARSRLGPVGADRAPGASRDRREPRPFRRDRGGSGGGLRRGRARGHPSLQRDEPALLARAGRRRRGARRSAHRLRSHRRRRARACPPLIARR